MKLRKLISTFIFTVGLAGFTINAAIPAGYYNSLNGKKDGELKTAIYNLVRNFTQVSSYSALPSYFQRTDVYPESKRWWDMYSNIPFYAPSFSGLNREHSFPKSWWGGLTDVPAYVDLNHLYPSEAAANMAKSNYPLGEVNRNQNIKFQNGITTVGYPVAGQGGGAGFVFEPADEYKGDFARTYFYMVTCYQNLTWKYFYMVSQNLYPTLTTWASDVLIKWHRQDPVSDKETMRNEEVYKIQNNRNPFIDYPELAELLWGNKKGETFNASTSVSPSGDPNLITPVQDMSLDFGQVAEGSSTTAKLWFNGEHLASPVNIRIYTGDANYFTVPTNSIAASLINSEDGYWLTLTYTPDKIGMHTSRLLIQGGGVPGSRGIELRGECLPVPTLTAPVAYAATDVTTNSYVANWGIAEGEVIDYFLINRTIYKDGGVSYQQVLAEEPGTEIEDFENSDSETYTVQSVRLGYVSDESNVIQVNNPAGNASITNDMAWAVENIPGGLRIMSSETLPVVNIYDAAGRTILSLENVQPYTDIILPAGVYFVRTDISRRPVKIMIR